MTRRAGENGEVGSDEMDAVNRVRDALLAASHEDSIQSFATGTRSAADAAASVGCEVAQIAKSIVFRAGDMPVVVVASGANRIDRKKVAAATGLVVKPAEPVWVHERTGFAVGGVAPVGHACPVTVVIDADLLPLDPLWAAAGSPSHVFRTSAQKLISLTGGQVADVRQD
ncbi:cys-tRNA(pro)/cys-tRNA(cys) deacylase [Azorhizobium oxalatiphilum]|uniref:Cys-tRNA(Pro)/cys-tRNA(Cys) deacylase n=1 Tax=Azorhizobium oxalatiphilum TaxID=980631 RepID=A0A917F911_9HYPH|nr:YbaK/EbsC family protein [Azorhizobium oxalatiphilum]GGF54499.1 cys-tRNA(pro)/cys-tRNA(cys) deacylase [Azorhizobium oxalatiphilum]